MRPSTRADYLPLSPLQQGLLIGHAAGESDVYVLQLVADLVGVPELDRLRVATTRLLARHRHLGASFRTRTSGEPLQVIPGDPEPAWTEVDLCHLQPDDAASEANRLTVADRTLGFDLRRGPLMRGTVIALPGRTSRLLLAVHHIVVDGWSIPILLRDLFHCYNNGDLPAQPEPSSYETYKDYLRWLNSRDEDAAREAWRHALAGVQSPTAVAPAGSADSRTAPAIVAAELSAQVTSQLARWARQHELTLNTVLQGAWGLVLGQLTGRADVVFGSVDSGRGADVPGIESMPGMCANTVPVRVRLDPHSTIPDAFTALQSQQLDLSSHRHLGLGEVQRLASVGALFDSLLLFQNYSMDDADGLELGGAAIVGATVEAATEYPLTLVAVPGEVLQLQAQYRPEVLETALVEPLLARLAHLLERLPQLSQATIGTIQLTHPDEDRTVSGFAAGTTADLAGALPCHLLGAALASDPMGVALQTTQGQVLARDLQARASRLARHLLEQGVGPERVVAIALPRTADLVVAVLAVLQTGAAYLPLDPAQPAERLDFMIRDAAPTVLLTTSDVAAPLFAGEPAGLCTVTLDAHDVALALGNLSDTPVRDSERCGVLSEHHPAYVIYTSGSTGRPKGVVVTHGALANLLTDYVAVLGLTAADRALAVTTFGFDIAMTELLAPLLAGGTVVLADDATTHDPLLLSSALDELAITVMQATPAHWRALVDAAPARLRGLRAATGGEALPSSLAEALLDAGACVMNFYGPTETTIWSSVAMVDGSRVGTPAIGRPLAGNVLNVLDAALRRLPTGVAGELYIGGAGVARGYLNRSGLTAERFIADPYGAPGARMYRTGDLCRWGRDGQLEYLGRTDHQIKLNGYRIELAEIESVLTEHPAVTLAAVKPGFGAQDRSTATHLSAFVAAPDGGVGVGDLTEHLRSRLPAYMVPSVITILGALPLNASGKIDRRALPDEAAPDSAAGDAADPATQIMCGVFAAVLGLADVGAAGNFFALGGHSLMATTLVARVRSVFDVEIAVRAVFDHPTPALLAAHLDSSPEARLRLGRRPRPDAPPLSAAQARMWFLNQLDPGGAAYNVALAVRMTGELDVSALASALADASGRHEILRTIYPTTSTGSYQAVLDEAVGALVLQVTVVTDIAALPGLLTAEAAKGFELATELPARARLFFLDENEHVLLLVIHHVAVDGASMAPLVADLANAYSARQLGRVPTWAPLPVQYVDYTLWQQEMLGEVDEPTSQRAIQSAFWRAALAGAPEELELPADRARPLVASTSGGSVRFDLTAEDHTQLRDVAREAGVTPFMVVQAALAALLTRLGAGTDIPLGSPVAGRTDEVLSDVVGLFVNTLVLRTDTSGDPAFAELLRRVRDTDLAAWAHQDLPFENVVEALNPSRSLVRHPLFQVMLIHQNNASIAFELPGLHCVAEPLETVAAKFDLAFILTEERQEGRPDGTSGVLEFSTDLFDRSTAEQLATRLVRLLRSALGDVSKRLSALDVLSVDERRELLEVWSTDPRSSLPAAVAPTSVYEVFVAHASRRPEHTALLWPSPTSDPGGGEQSYAELLRDANQLAREFMAQGVRPGDVVALVLPRSAGLVTAALGVLAAGAAYLPVDPRYPADRIAFMLQDGQTAVVVTTGDVLDRGGLAGTGGPILVLDDLDVARRVSSHDDSVVAPQERARPVCGADPAYLIYTSGSTGRPKGVLVSHASVVALADDHAQRFGLGPDTRALQYASFSFDAAVWEMCVSLLVGGTLVLVPDHARAGEALATFLWRFGVNLAVLPPVVLAALPETCELPPDMVLVVAGEACPAEVVSRWSTKHRMINAYGPTEATVCVSVSDPLSGVGAPPIGRPVAGHRVHVLDDWLEPVPPGVIGSLYVGGEGLALGYLGRAALTAARFVADPFRTGGRLYRSGDLVRWRSDGQLDFVGRDDQQVKLRGHRIELSEIETVLLEDPAVHQAVVVVREDRPRDKVLVGYVVAAGNDDVDGARLHALLTSRLPGFMLPAAVLTVSEIPLTVHGKLDRDALPSPSDDQRTVDAGRPPETALERLLAEEFAIVLGREVTGVDADFFDLGGNSIRTVELAGRLHKAGLLLEIADVFTHRTVAALAGAGIANRREPGWQDDPGRHCAVPEDSRLSRELASSQVVTDPFAEVLAIRQTGVEAPLFCIHGGAGLSLPYLGLATSIHVDRPILAFQAPALQPGSSFPSSVEALAAHYVGRVMQLQSHGPYHLLGWSFGGLVAQEMAVQLTERGETVEVLLNLDAYPYDPLSDAATMDASTLLARFLEYLGYSAAAQSLARSGDLDVVGVLRQLAREGSPLASLGGERVQRLVDVMRGHVELVSRFVPRPFEGNMDLFVATQGLDRQQVADRTSRWRGLVRSCVAYEVDVQHEYLMHPEPQRHIARIVDDRLRTLNCAPLGSELL